MSRKAIASPSGVAVGPYSHAIDTGELVFLSARSTVAVAGLPIGAQVEIEMVALRDSGMP